MTFIDEYINVMTMRKILLTLLIITLIAPAMAQVAAAHTQQDQQETSHHHDHSSHGGSDLGITFDSDNGFPYVAPTEEGAVSPDRDIEKVEFNKAVPMSAGVSIKRMEMEARGPPGWASVALLPEQPSLILTTQRFRI